MPFPPSYQGARTDASPATPDSHAADHTTLDQADKDIVAEIVAHEASTTAHGIAATIAAAVASYQPLDSDLTAIAALTTTTFGRSLLALADAAAARTTLGLGSAATASTSAFDAAGAAAAAQAASQPLDSDLTAIAALTTTTFGRSLLALADAAAARTALGLGSAATSSASAFEVAGAAAAAQAASQPLDSDLTAIAALTTTTFGRSLLALADAAAARAAIGAGTGNGDALTTSGLNQFASTTSAQLASVLSDETGTGSVVFSNSPTLVSPNLDTPSVLVLTNASGLPASALPAMTGDVTAAAGSHATTLAASGVTAGTYGSSAAVPVITFDAKGRATAATTAAIADSPATMILSRIQFK